jgi:hypothetical protein
VSLKTRMHMWFDTVTMEPRYGFQVNTGIGWRHAVKGSEVLLFDTPSEAAAEMARVRRAALEEAK